MNRVQRLLCTVALSCLSIQAYGQAETQFELPDGDGKDLVQAICVACHETKLIDGSTGYSQDGWKFLISKMIQLPDPMAETITQYLAANFPEKTFRRPTLLDGPETISFEEWTVPTLGQRPRDPLPMADGTIWWAGMYGDLLGHLDPRTGVMKEFKLASGAQPHGIAADKDGNIWYTGNGNGTVGMLNPDSGSITIYPMPDPAARDPHTPIFDRNGALWFTIQHSNMLGRLIPETSEIKLITMPTEGAKPYGIKEDSNGLIWVVYAGSNKLASVDAETMEVIEYPTPTPETIIRRLAFSSDGMLWYVDSSRGHLGRFDPSTGEFKTWPSPSGPMSHPYAIEVIDDVIWYNEAARRPDALVRFDPKTEEFQSWAIPSGVGIIRHMLADADGNLVIHQSSTNTVGIVTIGK